GDGKPDLIVACAGGRTGVSVFLGNGDGTFNPAVTYGVNYVSCTSVAVADLNGDGTPDIVVTNGNMIGFGVSVLLGNGDGTFGTAVSWPVGAGPTALAIGDVNGDGSPDIFVANTDGNSISVLLGTGNGTFKTAVSYVAGPSPVSVALVDVNADGKLDLVL